MHGTSSTLDGIGISGSNRDLHRNSDTENICVPELHVGSHYWWIPGDYRSGCGNLGVEHKCLADR